MFHSDGWSRLITRRTCHFHIHTIVAFITSCPSHSTYDPHRKISIVSAKVNRFFWKYFSYSCILVYDQSMKINPTYLRYGFLIGNTTRFSFFVVTKHIVFWLSHRLIVKHILQLGSTYWLWKSSTWVSISLNIPIIPHWRILLHKLPYRHSFLYQQQRKQVFFIYNGTERLVAHSSSMSQMVSLTGMDQRAKLLSLTITYFDTISLIILHLWWWSMEHTSQSLAFSSIYCRDWILSISDGV